MKRLSGLQWIIVLLTLATAVIHLYLGASNWGTNPTMAVLWALDGVGYIVILALLYFSGRSGRGRSTMRWILILYTLLTLILYFVFEGSHAFENTLGLITKAIEALLIILLFIDRGSDHEVVPATVVTPVATTTDSALAGRTLAEVGGDTGSAGATVTGAAAAAAVAAAASKADDSVDTADRTMDPLTGMSREALMTYFGDIDSLGEDAWRARLMGHLSLIGDTAEFDKPIEYIEGIGDVFGRKWRAINVTRTVDLLVLGATRKGRTALAKRSGFGETEILSWANQVDLYRIHGVGKQYADLLEQSGVDTVIELAGRNPANLQKLMVEVNDRRKLVRRTPTLTEVESWVNQAATLPRIMHY